MKKRILTACMYLLAAIAVAEYFDALYGGGPVTKHLGVVHAGIASAAVLAVGCLLSLFKLELGAGCGLIGCSLAWPYFRHILISFPWTKLFEVLPYAMWADSLAALVVLIVASIYSVVQTYSWVRARRSAAVSGH